MSDIQAQLRDSIANPEPFAAPPLIIDSAPVPPSVAGEALIDDSGQNALPPSFPLGQAGTWMPPPQVGMGGNAPFATPVVPPGTGTPGFTEPRYASGSGTAPAISTFFPSFSAAGPFQPIVLTAIMNTSLETSQNPTTAGTQPITQSTTAPPVITPTAFDEETMMMAAPPKPKPEPPPPEPEPEPEDPSAPEEDEPSITVHRSTTVHVSKPKGKNKRK